jgi:hypothetical protein
MSEMILGLRPIGSEDKPIEFFYWAYDNAMSDAWRDAGIALNDKPHALQDKAVSAVLESLRAKDRKESQKLIELRQEKSQLTSLQDIDDINGEIGECAEAALEASEDLSEWMFVKKMKDNNLDLYKQYELTTEYSE